VATAIGRGRPLPVQPGERVVLVEDLPGTSEDLGTAAEIDQDGMVVVEPTRSAEQPMPERVPRGRPAG
jgi:hypothetical protein